MNAIRSHNGENIFVILYLEILQIFRELGLFYNDSYNKITRNIYQRHSLSELRDIVCRTDSTKMENHTTKETFIPSTYFVASKYVFCSLKN